MQRTRIKICGLTRAEDVSRRRRRRRRRARLRVLSDKSPRFVTAAQAGALMAAVPPFVTTVGAVRQRQRGGGGARSPHMAPVSLLQFHGDETPAQCAAIAAAVQPPFMRVFRVRPDTRARRFARI